MSVDNFLKNVFYKSSFSTLSKGLDWRVFNVHNVPKRLNIMYNFFNLIYHCVMEVKYEIKENPVWCLCMQLGQLKRHNM